MARPSFSEGFVPCAVRISFSPRAYDRSLDRFGKEVLRDCRDVPALRVMVSLSLTAVPVFVTQILLGMPRLLLVIAFYRSLYGLKFQRSVRMFSAKHLEAHRARGYFSEKYEKLFGRYAEFFWGYLYGDLPELGRTVHVRLHHKDNGGLEDSVASSGYDRTSRLHFLWYLSDNISDDAWHCSIRLLQSQERCKEPKTSVMGNNAVLRLLRSCLCLRLENWNSVRGSSSSMHEFHYGNHLMGAARLL
jgi:hypothetical protein